MGIYKLVIKQVISKYNVTKERTRERSRGNCLGLRKLRELSQSILIKVGEALLEGMCIDIEVLYTC